MLVEPGLEHGAEHVAHHAVDGLAGAAPGTAVETGEILLHGGAGRGLDQALGDIGAEAGVGHRRDPRNAGRRDAATARA